MRLLDRKLRTVRRSPLVLPEPPIPVVCGRRAFGVDGDRLVVLRLRDLRLRELGRLPTSDVVALAAVRGAAPLRGRTARASACSGGSSPRGGGA